MKKVVLAIGFVLIGATIFAQKSEGTNYTRPQNNISTNFFGDASVISANYERLFLINSRFFLTGKLGIGYNEEYSLPIMRSNTPADQFLTFTHHITANYGEKKYFFEFGLGGTAVSGNTDMKYLLYPIVGYRYQPLIPCRVNFRIFACPPIGQYRYTKMWFVPFGASVGITL